MSDSEYDISSGDELTTAAVAAGHEQKAPQQRQPLQMPTEAVAPQQEQKKTPIKQPKVAKHQSKQEVDGVSGVAPQQVAALKENIEKVKKVRKSRAKNTPVSDFQQVKARDEATLENTKLIMSLVERIEFLDKKLDSATNGVQAKRAAEIQSNLHQAKAMFAKFSR